MQRCRQSADRTHTNQAARRSPILPNTESGTSPQKADLSSIPKEDHLDRNVVGPRLWVSADVVADDMAYGQLQVVKDKEV